MSRRPAILGGTPVRAGKQWPRWPQHDESEREALETVLASGHWTGLDGPQGAALEAEFAAFQGGTHGIAVANGTLTLEAALAACGVGEGDEVIVPALTFVATATAVLAVNATPVLVDIDPGTLCLDVEAAAAAVGERTRAIVPVHLAGVACDLDALLALCERHDLALVEDAAHAHGTRWRGRGVGCYGSFGSFSFQGNKLLTAGEGGALLSEREELRARAWTYVNCGRADPGPGFNHVSYGSNLRLSEWQAAVLRTQLRRLPEQNRVRAERAALLDAELAAVPGLRPQAGDERMDARAYYSYVLHYDPAQFSGLSLEGFEQALAREGVPVGRCYPSLNTLELFERRAFAPRLRQSAPAIDYGSVRAPNAERAAQATVWLDHRLLLADPDDVGDVAVAIARIQASSRAVALRTGRAAKLGGRLARRLRRREEP